MPGASGAAVIVLSALEQTLFGWAEGKEEANAHDATCAKADTVLSPIEYGMLDCGDGGEEEASAHDVACANDPWREIWTSRSSHVVRIWIQERLSLPA